MPRTSIVLSFLLTFSVTLTGQREVKGPADPVRASVGQDVVLPCAVEPPVDVSTLTVEWSINNTMVHVYRNKRDDVNLQHKDFKKRTSLFKEELVNGNISLNLSSVQKTDGRTYTCHVPQLTDPVKKVDIELIVEDNVSNTRDSSSSSDRDTMERNSATTQTSVLALPLFLALASLLYTCKRKRRRSRPESREQ